MLTVENPINICHFEICSLFEERYRVINRDVSKGQKIKSKRRHTNWHTPHSKQATSTSTSSFDWQINETKPRKQETENDSAAIFSNACLFTIHFSRLLLRRELLGLQLQTQTQGSTTITFTTFLSFNVSKHFNFSFSSLINLM